MFQIGCLTRRLALLGGSSLNSLAAGAVHGNRVGPVGREPKFHISKFTDRFLLSYHLAQLWVIPSIVQQISFACVINWKDKINNIVFFFLVAHIYYRGEFRVWIELI